MHPSLRTRVRGGLGIVSTSQRTFWQVVRVSRGPLLIVRFPKREDRPSLPCSATPHKLHLHARGLRDAHWSISTQAAPRGRRRSKKRIAEKRACGAENSRFPTFRYAGQVGGAHMATGMSGLGRSRRLPLSCIDFFFLHLCLNLSVWSVVHCSLRRRTFARRGASGDPCMRTASRASRAVPLFVCSSPRSLAPAARGERRSGDDSQLAPALRLSGHERE